MSRLVPAPLLVGALLLGCSDIGEAVGRWAAGKPAEESEDGAGPSWDQVVNEAAGEGAEAAPVRQGGGRDAQSRRSETGQGKKRRGKRPVAMYINGSGEVVKVDSVDKVPEEFRGTMIVIGKRLPDGGAGLSVVDDSQGRKAFRDATERWHRAAQEHSVPTRVRPRTGGGGGVILYQTSWCPACKAARDYLDQRGIAYQVKDVEKSASARKEFSKYGSSSVPLVLVKGTPIRGFNPDAIEKALR